MKRRGFTLIELMVVIALLAILSTLLVIGIGKLQLNSKRQQTRLIMQNLSAMFADFDVNRRVPMGMGNFAGFNGLPLTGTPSQQTILNSLFTSCPQNVALDYNTAAEAATAMPTALQPSADRKGMDVYTAVPDTRAFMALLMSTPNNASSVGKLPSGSLMTFAGSDPSNFQKTPVAWLAGTKYSIGEYVTDGGATYIRTQLKLDQSGNISSDTTTEEPPNYYYWMPALRVANPTVLPSPPGTQGTPLPTPVLLDAWGNPIIFVPGGVLGATTTYTLATDAHNNLVPPAGSGGMISNYGTASVEIQVHSPDYHPFFASAGPDGDFSRSDDNLYSFEK